MGIDSQSDFKPSTPEKVKSAGVKSKETKPASEFLLTVRQNVEGILNHWKGNKHSQEIIHNLGSIEIPEDQKSPTNQSSPEVSPKNSHQPSETTLNTPQQDQQEISLLTQEIQQLQTESSPVPELVSKKLFPDHPSLYSQHHEVYDRERKTIAGEITRLKDITALKMAGVKKAAYTYDGLRSRGISRDQIMKNDTGEFPRISRILRNNWESDTKEYKKPYSYIDLPKNIDRLHSIGKFDLDSFSSDEKFSNTETAASILSHQTDEQFQETREKLNNFPFLSGSYILRFFHGNELPPDTFDTLSYLKKEYFSDPQYEAKFESFLSKRYPSKDYLFSGLNHEINSSGITDLVTTLIGSGVNDDKKIEIPPELLKFCRETELDFIHCLSDLKDRDEQKFLVGRMGISGKWEDIASHYFDSDHQPNFNFYHDFISSSEPSNAPVVIPSRIIDSIQDPELKSSFNIVSNLPERQFQKYFLTLKNKNLNPNNYIYDGNMNFSFYRALLCDGHMDTSPIPVEHLSHLPDDQQRIINLTSLITSSNATNAAELRELLFRNYQDFDLFFDKKNQPTSHFFETYVQQYQSSLFNTEALKATLTPDVLATFSPEDQKLWKIVLNFKRTDMGLPLFVVNNRQQIDSFFDSESKPTSLFFKNLISKTNFQDLSDFGFIRSSLTPDLISTFSPEDQTLWNSVVGLKKIDSSILKIIVDKYHQTDLYFNENNQPTSFLFESLIKDTTGHLNVSETGFLKSNLTPELLATFSPEDQKFWTGFLSLKSINEATLNSIISNKNKDNTALYFNENNQPTDFFFREIIKMNIEDSSINSLSIIKANLTPEVIATFSPEDQRFWKFLYEKNFSLENKKKIISDNLASFIMEKRDVLASNSSDFDFLNSLVGNFGKKSESIINSYCQCIESKVITKEDKPLVLEFLKEFKVLTPKIITGYKEAKYNQTEKLFISNLKEIARKLISSEQLSDTDSRSPYYSDLIKHVYSNNSGKWASYESNDSCPDLNNQLSQFEIQDIYQIDLLSQSEIRVKANQKPDQSIQQELESPVSRILENLKSINFDQEKGNQYLNQKLDTILSTANLPENLDLSQLSLEEKLFLVVSEYSYNHHNINPDDIKNLLITYEFVNFEDIRNFIQGTNDKVSHAANPDYAHLCELSNFYSDRIKEVNKRIIESAASSQHLNDLLPYYFGKLVKQSSEQTSQDSLNKFQVDKLGLTNSFLDQISKVLKRRFPDRQFSPDQVKRMLHIYETVTQGLTEPKSTSLNKNTQALYGQLRSQREKTFGLLKQLSNEAIDPRSIHLDEIDLKQALSVKKSIETNNYSQDEFLAYTSQKFIDVFSSERSKLESELSKYESETGSQREILNAFITKTKSSANARMVGGVCVSGDNPTSPSGKQAGENIWNMPNYFQMVFQDPETYQCLGLCLMHHFQEGDKKVLTVSLNPSSTYLYSVDEASLFNGILNTIQEFASNNNFDYITVSKNKTIRTNRTGGVFEQAIDKKISQVNQTFSFSKEEQFSYSPTYKLKDMDIIWNRSSSN